MKTDFFDFNNNIDNNVLKNLGKNLQHGTIGIFPTDTVYGIGCNAFDDIAIHKLFELKNRDYSKPINVLISNISMLNELVESISNKEQRLISAFWPGALTIIFNKKNSVSDILTSDLNTIGVRMPDNSITLDLIEYSGTPLATTSANISGEPAAIKTSEIYNNFNNKVDFIINGGTSNIGQASTVVQIIDDIPHILREGSISKTQIENALKN